MKRINLILPFTFGLAALLMSACTADPLEVDEVLANLDAHVGKRITMKAHFRSGARCRIGEEEGQWQTYCKGECQYCRGPLVVTGKTAPDNLDDWPMVLGGLWDGQPIKCQGPLNKVECHPFELGKEYVVRGVIEAQKPPRLMVKDWWKAEDF